MSGTSAATYWNHNAAFHGELVADAARRAGAAGRMGVRKCSRPPPSTMDATPRYTWCMTIAQISQREMRNDSGAVLRRVEAGEVLEVTRRGVPVARLVPLSDDSDLRCIRPATRSINYADFPRILSGEPSEVTMAAIRDDR